jgi:hypothetical protein
VEWPANTFTVNYRYLPIDTVRYRLERSQWVQKLDTPARLGGGGGVFGGLEPLHRYNLHFTEGFLRPSRYKAVTKALQAVTKRTSRVLGLSLHDATGQITAAEIATLPPSSQKTPGIGSVRCQPGHQPKNLMTPVRPFLLCQKSS